MGSSFKLFSVWGIDIKMHITFPLILVWAAVQFGYLADGGTTGAIFGIIVVSLLFAIVTLHELGHSYAALKYGVPVNDIVLLPIGGVAQLKRIPENPWQEFVIAIAGPAVNFALAVILWLISIPTGYPLIPNLANVGAIEAITLDQIFAYVFVYNLFLGVFNLLPAFPMDGGRILRAALAARLPYHRATSIAATVGRGMAWLMGLYGFITGGYGLILIAFFIYLGAGQERSAVQLRSILGGLKVEQAYSRQVQSLRLTDSLQDAVDITLSSFQATFPVRNEVGELKGILPYTRLVEALREQDHSTPVGRVMITDVPSVNPAQELIEAQQMIRESRGDALPVVENGRFLGLITSNDIGEVLRLLSVDPNLLPRQKGPLEAPNEPATEKPAWPTTP